MRRVGGRRTAPAAVISPERGPGASPIVNQPHVAPWHCCPGGAPLVALALDAGPGRAAATGKAGILQSAPVWHCTQTPAVVQMGAVAPQSVEVAQPRTRRSRCRRGRGGRRSPRWTCSPRGTGCRRRRGSRACSRCRRGTGRSAPP